MGNRDPRITVTAEFTFDPCNNCMLVFSQESAFSQAVEWTIIAFLLMSGWKTLCLWYKTLESRVVSVVEISAVEGVWTRRSYNGLVAVTLGPPTPSTEAIWPVDRISIEAVDDVDQLAVSSGEGGWVGEGQAGSQEAGKQARQYDDNSASHGKLFAVQANGN